jgi:hypothetical protein
MATNVVYDKAASVDLRYSTNCGATPGWADGDYIYLVGTMGNDGLFYLDTTQWWTNTLPSTNDGKLYMRVGLYVNSYAYSCSLLTKHPVFYHDGTSIKEYGGGTSYSAGSGITIANDTISIDSSVVATQADISDMATQTWVGQQGYLTTITGSNVTNALGYTPVNKAGDTMTGPLDNMNTSVTKGTNPSVNKYWEWRNLDNNQNPAEWYTNRMSAFQTTLYPNGTVETQIKAFQNDPTVSTTADFKMAITSSGVKSCEFPNTTCCDGQWVHSQLIAGTSVAKGTYNVSLSSYLPNDGHMYEVMINLRVYSSNSSNAGEVFVYSDVFSGTQYSSVNISGQGGAGGNSRQIGNTFILPVGTQRTITYKIESYAVTNLDLVLWGYRRIGTNA